MQFQLRDSDDKRPCRKSNNRVYERKSVDSIRYGLHSDDSAILFDDGQFLYTLSSSLFVILRT